MISGAVHDAERVWFSQQLIGAEGGVKGLLHGPGLRDLIIIAISNEARPWRYEGDQQVAVDGQAILAAGKKPQARNEPGGEVARRAFDTLAKAALASQPPRHDAANARAAGDHRGDARVEGRGDQGHLAVAGITVEGDVRLIDL